LKNKPVVALVSDAYQDDEESSDDQGKPSIDIETTLLNVGEDFRALVSIAVNPSYFFVQNTTFTRELEKLAQSMKIDMARRDRSSEFYAFHQPPSVPFRPAEMSCCAARYSVDSRWYRARVRRYSSGQQSLRVRCSIVVRLADTTVELVYLDYGNNEERSIDELRPLDPTFARLPAQAICAALEVGRTIFSRARSFVFSYCQCMAITIVHGRRRPVTNSTKTPWQSRWIFVSLHSQH
jgi:hypothetical protein